MTHDFHNVPGATASQLKKIERISRRDPYPASIKSRSLPQDILGNSNVATGSFSIGNGVVITLTARTVSDLGDDVRTGTVPFMIALFDSDTFGGINPGTNQIPWDVTTGNFDVYGPMAMPDYTVNGKRRASTYFATNGNDTVYKTGIRNSSGSDEIIQYIIQTRVLQPRGGERTTG